MHEMSIAMNVVEIATDQARNNGASRINQIVLEVGTLAGIMIDSLEFCFESACKGTMAEDAELRIEQREARGRCQDCDSEFEMETFLAICPNCESFKIEQISGQELKIKTINVD